MNQAGLELEDLLKWKKAIIFKLTILYAKQNILFFQLQQN